MKTKWSYVKNVRSELTRNSLTSSSISPCLSIDAPVWKVLAGASVESDWIFGVGVGAGD